MNELIKQDSSYCEEFPTLHGSDENSLSYFNANITWEEIH